jgi:hypothetical protein
MDRQIDYEQALLDPSTQFSQPDAVLKELGLTREQKIEILRRWAYDESEIAVAEEEGMKGGESSLLQPILIALEQLQGGIDIEHTSPTKQHAMPGISRELTRRKSE